jgi:hypothetical protein
MKDVTQDLLNPEKYPGPQIPCSKFVEATIFYFEERVIFEFRVYIIVKRSIIGKIVMYVFCNPIKAELVGLSTF